MPTSIAVTQLIEATLVSRTDSKLMAHSVLLGFVISDAHETDWWCDEPSAGACPLGCQCGGQRRVAKIPSDMM